VGHGRDGENTKGNRLLNVEILFIYLRVISLLPSPPKNVPGKAFLFSRYFGEDKARRMEGKGLNKAEKQGADLILDYLQKVKKIFVNLLVPLAQEINRASQNISAK